MRNYYDLIARRIKDLREKANITPTELENQLKLGSGWIESIESANYIPRLDEFLSILSYISLNEASNFLGYELPAPIPFPRFLNAIQSNNDIQLNFQYGKFDSTYTLNNANYNDFLNLMDTFQNDLSKSLNVDGNAHYTSAVKNAFLNAMSLFPDANPSDVWYFIISKMYIDPYNHPAINAKLDFSQSWKRTGGWALEEIVVTHYKQFLKQHGINIFIESNKDKKIQLIEQFNVSDRLEADKVDIFLTGLVNGSEIAFGVVHVKASFAERRTDDVPMSKALVEAGYTSPLWTMDCKCTPSAKPFNKGELGNAYSEGRDSRSAKRKDIEDDNYFSNCFSYNLNTNPTPVEFPAKNKIIICNFKNSNDDFSKYIIDSWNAFKAKL